MIYLLSFVLAISSLYIFRFTILGIPTTLLEISLYGVFFVGLLQQRALVHSTLKKYKERFTRSPAVVIFILFFLSLLFSIFISSDLKASLGAFKAWYIDGLLVCLLILFFVRTKKDYMIILGGLTLGALLVSIIGLWQYSTNHVLPDGRITSLYIYDNVVIASGGLANFVAMYLVPIIVLQIGFLCMLDKTRGKPHEISPLRFKTYTLTGIIQIALLCSLLLELIALYLTRSYGGIMALFGGVCVLGVYYLKTYTQVEVKRKIILAIIFLVILAIVLIPQLKSEKFKNLLNFDEASSSNARLQIWKASWFMAKDHPVRGVGLNNFEPVYREYIPKVVFPPLEWLVPHAHNLYLSLWLETGVMGLVSFLALMWIFLRRLIQKNNFLSIAIFASIVSILLHGFVDTPILKNDLAIIFWMLVGLGISVRNKYIINKNNLVKEESRSEERRVGKECRSRWSPYH